MPTESVELQQRPREGSEWPDHRLMPKGVPAAVYTSSPPREPVNLPSLCLEPEGEIECFLWLVKMEVPDQSWLYLIRPQASGQLGWESLSCCTTAAGLEYECWASLYSAVLSAVRCALLILQNCLGYSPFAWRDGEWLQKIHLSSEEKAGGQLHTPVWLFYEIEKKWQETCMDDQGVHKENQS